MSAQALWSLQSLTPVAQSIGELHTAVSATGDVYVTGPSGAFPWLPQPTNTIGDTSSEELLVAKLDANRVPLYTTAIGGTSAGSLTLDSAGNLYVYGGGANANAFATTPGAYNASAYVTSGDFVCKLSAADGSIVFCSFPGTGGYESGGLTADSRGNVYFAESPIFNYPNPTQGALALGLQFVQVTKLDSMGGILYRAQFSGSHGTANPTSIAADVQGDLWVAGNATGDFPTTPNAVLPSATQSPAGFLAELNPSGSALLYSTFTDGRGLEAQIALDSTGAIYETDVTAAGVGILRKYSPGGTAISNGQDFANSSLPSLPFVVSPAGEVTILSTTTSVNFPTYQPVAPCAPPGILGDWVLILVDPAGEILESTFLPVPIAYPLPSPQIALNGYFLMTSTPTSNEAEGPYQLYLGQLGPTTGTPVSLACVGNAASLTLAALAPGEIVSLFGTGLGPASPASAQFTNNLLPFHLAGTQVTFNGIPAPLLYSSGGQINAIAPWEIQGASTVNLCVALQGSSTNCVTMDVATTAPGIFSLPSGYAAAVNQDGTINSPQNPAAMGSVVSLYVTGLGPLLPEPADGSVVGFPLPTLVNGVQVAFYSSEPPATVVSEVQYAGPAPFEVAGLYQINVTIPILPTYPGTVSSYAVGIGVTFGPGLFMTSQVLPIAIQANSAGNSARR